MERVKRLQPLLYTREQTAELLGGISITTIRRLEKERILTPIRLSRSPTAQVFFAADQVHAVVREAVNG